MLNQDQGKTSRMLAPSRQTAIIWLRTPVPYNKDRSTNYTDILVSGGACPALALQYTKLPP